jgi:hypothetical protein
LYHFDATSLRAAIDSIPVSLRAAFACACGIRLDSAARQSGSVVSDDELALYQRIESAVLDGLSAPQDHPAVWPSLLRECMDRISVDDDEVLDVAEMLRDDCRASYAYALRSGISGNSQDAVWAAQRAYEAADRIANRNTTTDDEGEYDEFELISHPIVQRELARQMRDLKSLLVVEDTFDFKVKVEDMFRHAVLEGSEFSHWV